MSRAPRIHFSLFYIHFVVCNIHKITVFNLFLKFHGKAFANKLKIFTDQGIFM